MNPTHATLATDRAGVSRGTGWIPPVPDLRDYTEDRKEIREMASRLGIPAASPEPQLPKTKDLRPHCTPIEDQGQLGSCTANAAVGIVEYFEKRAFDRHIDGSRLFVYKATRDLMGVTGDTGAWLRNAMGALALCGVAPERYWPYSDDADTFDREPPPFVYAVADNFEALRYFCHDPISENRRPGDVLTSVKSFLAAGIPSMFGFWGFPSFDDADPVGGIPLPCPDERAEWGHAIVAVGYDDDKRITNTRCNRKAGKGALLIRNSWGEGWGEKGYGWMPYDYVTAGLATDFWSLISMKWIDTKNFGFEGV